MNNLPAKPLLFLGTLLILLASLSSCNKKRKDFIETPIPAAVLQTYYFGIGSEWVYLQENDSSSTDTFRLTDRYECSTLMVREIEGGTYLEAFNGNSQVSSPAYSVDGLETHASYTHSHPDLSGMGTQIFSLWHLAFDRWGIVPYNVYGFLNRGNWLTYDPDANKYKIPYSDSLVNTVSLTVPAGSFTDVLEINQLFTLFNFETKNSVDVHKVYLKPGMGILRWEYDLYSSDRSAVLPYAWDLQSYALR